MCGYVEMSFPMFHFIGIGALMLFGLGSFLGGGDEISSQTTQNPKNIVAMVVVVVLVRQIDFHGPTVFNHHYIGQLWAG